MLETVKAQILNCRIKHRATVIGISGIDASGKTAFTRALAEALGQDGYKVQMIHLDDFHHPAEIRRSNSVPPAQAYYTRTFDYPRVIKELLQPIQSGLPLTKELLCLDLEKDTFCLIRRYEIDRNTIVLMEGVFLFRPELLDLIDYKIHLHIDFDTCLKRVVARDGYLFGSPEDIIRRYKEKYLPGQSLYFLDANPMESADLVLDNTDFANLVRKK